jgi:hypothetical protein
MKRRVTHYSVELGRSPELWKFLIALALFTAAFAGLCWFMDEVAGIG